VLKVQQPHRESEHEADALALWDGEGAVRLLAHDRERHALLLERAVPGSSLLDVPEDAALDVAVALLPRLWKPAGAPFRALAAEAAWWVSYLPERWDAAGRPFERAVLDAAVATLCELAETQGEQVLVSQDFHAGNVLRAEREPWLAIDPKPLAGEREFGVAALVRDRDPNLRTVRARLDRLCAELALDRDRVRGWAFAQTLAWSFEGSDVLIGQVETAKLIHRA